MAKRGKRGAGSAFHEKHVAAQAAKAATVAKAAKAAKARPGSESGGGAWKSGGGSSGGKTALVTVCNVASPRLTLYVALHKDDAAHCQSRNIVPTRFVSPKKNVVGLRERAEDAIERYRLNFGEIEKEKLVLLQVSFTPLGLAYFTTQTCGPANRFCSQLSKMTYGTDVDWAVWHFVGDLPLDQPHFLVACWSEIL